MDYKISESLIRRELNSLARFSNPEKESWRRLKKAIINIADSIRIATGQIKPPIILDGAKELRHIKRELFFVSPKGPDALLSPEDTGFVVRLKKGQYKVRYRFSIAHEIGHTFFYDIYKNPPVRLLSSASSSRFSSKEEDICSTFARELLLPRDMLLHEIANIADEKDKLEFLLTIARRYQVSIEVLVRRLLWDLLELPNSVAILKMIQEQENNKQFIIRQYKGEKIRKYTRKKESQVIKQVLDILKSGPPYDKLGDVSALYSDIVEIWSRESTSGLQVVTLLSFKR